MKENKKEIIVKCEDNCSCLSVDKWDDDEFYFVTLYNSYFDSSFSKKLVDIWRIIRGKQIYHAEIVLSEKDYDKLRNFNK